MPRKIFNQLLSKSGTAPQYLQCCGTILTAPLYLKSMQLHSICNAAELQPDPSHHPISKAYPAPPYPQSRETMRIQHSNQTKEAKSLFELNETRFTNFDVRRLNRHYR